MPAVYAEEMVLVAMDVMDYLTAVKF